jgi:spore maturation protein CgeB
MKAMRFVMFYHSLVSDWNHGNAHFLRGVATELAARGHEVVVYEPQDGWSYSHLVREHGYEPIDQFRAAYPHLKSTFYTLANLELDVALADADVVMVHEWNDPELVGRIGTHRRNRGRYKLLFHDTHHRAVSDPSFLLGDALRAYDDVLVFGESLRDVYRKHNWSDAVWVWHESADTRVFKSYPSTTKTGDVVWIGNWGDGERNSEIEQFLLEPLRTTRLRSTAHGVRYPAAALQTLETAEVEYGGWLPNFKVPEVFSRHLMTVHIPRGPYREFLPGIPTIRVFEALACGIPLVCSPWNDCEGLFSPGKDYLTAKDSSDMTEILRTLSRSASIRHALSAHGLETISRRHTCGHRVDELLEIVRR